MARILVGWDGSETADGALEFARDQVGKDDELVVATVIPARLKDRSFLSMLFPQIEIPSEMEVNSYEANAKDRLEERIEKLDAPCPVTAVVRAGDPADELLRLVNEDGFHQLIVGYKSYETDLPNHVGSIAEKLVRYATVPITIYRPAPSRPG